MATVKEILALIDDSVNSFNAGIPKVQQQLFDELIELASRLTVKNNRIQASARNIRLIAEIKQRFDKLITKNKGYNENVKQFTAAFEKVAELQTEYFTETIQKFSAPKTLEAIRAESIQSTIDNLRGTGMRAKLIDPIREILRVNITSGAKFTDLTKGLREFLINSPKGDGALAQHIKTTTTDALNTYARTNNDAVTNDLGLSWYNYTGAIIETSRPFCKALHAKKYFHKSEIPKLLKGDFKEFHAIKGEIYDKTGLPYGMKKETNADNFLTLAGGWGCAHIPIPVDELAVPERIKNAL